MTPFYVYDPVLRLPVYVNPRGLTPFTRGLTPFTFFTNRDPVYESRGLTPFTNVNPRGLTPFTRIIYFLIFRFVP